MKAVWPIRIYYEDTDAGGVVYHAQYLNFFERARTEWLRALGFEQDVLIADYQLIFAVRRLNIEYRLPARFNERLEVISTMKRMASASMVFMQTLQRLDGSVLTEAEVHVACIDSEKLKPRRLPDEIKQRFLNDD